MEDTFVFALEFRVLALHRGQVGHSRGRPAGQNHQKAVALGKTRRATAAGDARVTLINENRPVRGRAKRTTTASSRRSSTSEFERSTSEFERSTSGREWRIRKPE